MMTLRSGGGRMRMIRNLFRAVFVIYSKSLKLIEGRRLNFFNNGRPRRIT